MGLLDYLRKKSKNEPEGFVNLPATAAFNDVLSVAKAMWVYHQQTRHDPNYDVNIGFGLAQRYTDDPPPPMQFIATSCVLRSHCGEDALPMFLDSLRGKVTPFGIEITANGQFFVAKEVRGLAFIIDLYGLAQNTSKFGEMDIDWSPFRGLAAEIWDAGFQGLPANAATAEALTFRALNLWNDAKNLDESEFVLPE